MRKYFREGDRERKKERVEERGTDRLIIKKVTSRGRVI